MYVYVPSTLNIYTVCSADGKECKNSVADAITTHALVPQKESQVKPQEEKWGYLNTHYMRCARVKGGIKCEECA
jgi:hypothetical protein